MNRFSLVPVREFSVSNAIVLAEVSSLVYKSYSDIKLVLGAGGYRFEYFDRGDTQALLVDVGQDMILVYRGTEVRVFGDWFTDLRVKKEQTNYGYIHSGFYNGWKQISSDVSKIVNSWKKRGIWITGHSLGGAIATIDALMNEHSLVAGVYTFGSPRVGDRQFVRNYDVLFGDITYRVVRNDDVVARIPQRILGYHHCKQIVYFNSDDKLLLGEEAYSGWRAFLDRIAGKFEGYLQLELASIQDHSLDGYIEALRGVEL